MFLVRFSCFSVVAELSFVPLHHRVVVHRKTSSCESVHNTKPQGTNNDANQQHTNRTPNVALVLMLHHIVLYVLDCIGLCCGVVKLWKQKCFSYKNTIRFFPLNTSLS